MTALTNLMTLGRAAGLLFRSDTVIAQSSRLRKIVVPQSNSYAFPNGCGRANTALTVTANRAYLFRFNFDAQFDALVASTTATNAGNFARIARYNADPNTLMPTTLIDQYGGTSGFDLSTSGSIIATLSAVEVMSVARPNGFWGAVVFSAALTSVTASAGSTLADVAVTSLASSSNLTNHLTGNFAAFPAAGDWPADARGTVWNGSVLTPAYSGNPPLLVSRVQ